jgi:SAM-dependent methyltransferase
VARVVGLEPNSAALRHARERGYPVVRGSARALPFAAGAFDLVTCLDVLQHLGPGGDVRAMDEIARVLRPGGVVLIRSNGRGWAGDQVRVEGTRPYRLGELAGKVQRAGLQVLRASYANCLPSLAQEVRGRLDWIARRRGGMLPHPSAGGLRIRMPSSGRNRLMGAIVGGEAVLAGGLGVVLPFGHSTMVLARKAATTR